MYFFFDYSYVHIFCVSTCVLDRNKKQEPREEFNDWPRGLLAIGTFGNNPEINNNKGNNDSEIQNIQDDQEEASSSIDLQDFTPEEIGKFEKELTKLLRRKPNSDKEKKVASLPLDRFLNCPSSLEVDRRISNAICNEISDDHHNKDHDNQDIKDEDIDRTISVILGRCKDIRADSSKKAIGKKSISFLLKKMFVCRSGFAPQPSLRDSLQESRMERVSKRSSKLLIFIFLSKQAGFQLRSLCINPRDFTN